MELVFNYIGLLFIMFFISFFLDKFVRFAMKKEVVNSPMFTVKKGGLFEFFLPVFGVVLVLGILHASVPSFNPFETDNALGTIVSSFVLFFSSLLLFMILFTFISLAVLGIVISIIRIEDKRTFFKRNNYRILMVSFGLSFIFAVMFLFVIPTLA